jgi:putative flippase GtrA
MGVVWLAQTLQYQPFTLIIEFTADVWAKGIAGVAVIIANYIISKYFVFNKKG